jgi:hypothetical protein
MRPSHETAENLRWSQFEPSQPAAPWEILTDVARRVPRFYREP